MIFDISNIEWQEAIIVVKTIEVPAFLVAVDRVVGGIEVKGDLLGRLVVGFDE